MPLYSPLHEVTAQAGAAFVEEAGWLMPARFTTPEEEYRRGREGAVVFDQSRRGKLELRGPDARLFLHRLSSNDVAALPADGGCEVFLCNAKAKIISHGFVFPLSATTGPESLWLDVAPGLAEKTLEHLDHFLISEQVELLDRTRDFAQLLVAGPLAKQVLETVLHSAVGDLPKLRQRQCRWNDANVFVRRVDLLASDSYDLVCPASDGPRLWPALVTAGATPAGMEAFHVFRIEAGTPLYGVDIDDNTLAMEVGRTPQAISYTKGCFPGQEPIVRARDLGHVNWSFCGFVVEGLGEVSPGAKLRKDGKEVGRITSSAASPRFGATLALGYVRRGHEIPATSLELVIEGAERRVTVSALPFAS